MADTDTDTGATQEAPATSAPAKPEEPSLDLSFLEADDSEPEEAPAPQKPTEPEPAEPAEPEVKEPEKKEEVKEEEKKEEPTESRSIEEIRQSFLEDVTASYGNTLTPEEREAVGEDLATLLPKLAARVHVDVYDAAIRTLFSQLPAAILAYESTRQQYKSVEDEFAEKWPQLKGQDEAVGRIAKAYRSAYPDATKEQAIEDVGLIAVQKLGLQKTQPKAGNGQQGSSSLKTRQSREALPPVPGGAGKVQPARREKNMFEELAEFEMEDT